MDQGRIGPESAEVWCEGARIFMNPLGHAFNLQRANKVLEGCWRVNRVGSGGRVFAVAAS